MMQVLEAEGRMMSVALYMMMATFQLGQSQPGYGYLDVSTSYKLAHVTVLFLAGPSPSFLLLSLPQASSAEAHW